MFAGIGGFRSGLEQAGHTCVGYIEFDKFARKSYQAIYSTKGEYTAHDIRKVNGKELPDADIWTFGSPCQDISFAGKQKGLQGSRSSLFFEVMRMLDERQEAKKFLPSYLIMENVKALLSSSQGWDFATVLIEMEKIARTLKKDLTKDQQNDEAFMSKRRYCQLPQNEFWGLVVR